MFLNLKKYSKSFLKRIIISICLLLLSTILIKIQPFNNIVMTNFNKPINVINHIISMKNILINDDNFQNETIVSTENIYDYTSYDGRINHITNYDFNGVKAACEGLIIQINKKDNNLYDVYVQNKNSYIYIYQNLESVDFGIYTYLDFQAIIGASKYETSSNSYNFELEILKEQRRYSLNELTEN